MGAIRLVAYEIRERGGSRRVAGSSDLQPCLVTMALSIDSQGIQCCGESDGQRRIPLETLRDPKIGAGAPNLKTFHGESLVSSGAG
jgi:hypothetical protein